MKLDKESKQLLTVGCILSNARTSEKYIVTTLLENKRGNMLITVQDMKTRLYLVRVSMFYGFTLEKPEK